MADGSIVYEVRVNSENVEGDLSKVSAVLDKGTKEVQRLALNTASIFGTMLGQMFGTSTVQAESSVTKLSQSFDKLKTALSPLMSALAPIAQKLAEIAKINLQNLGAITGKTANTTTSPSPPVSGPAPKAAASFEVGTSYIPYDNFPALLHKGEAVLTASENAALKAAGGIGALREPTPVVIKNDMDMAAIGELGRRPVEVMLKIGDYEFTQIITDTMNNLYRQWGTKPLK